MPVRNAPLPGFACQSRCLLIQSNDAAAVQALVTIQEAHSAADLEFRPCERWSRPWRRWPVEDFDVIDVRSALQIESSVRNPCPPSTLIRIIDSEVCITHCHDFAAMHGPVFITQESYRHAQVQVAPYFHDAPCFVAQLACRHLDAIQVEGTGLGQMVN